jgi:hypothetical protein
MDIDNIEQLFLLKLTNESIDVFKKMIGEKYIEKVSSIQPKEGLWVKIDIRHGIIIFSTSDDDSLDEETKNILVKRDKENNTKKFIVVDENFKISSLKKNKNTESMKAPKKPSKNKTKKNKKKGNKGKGKKGKKKGKKGKKGKKKQKGGGPVHSKKESASDMLEYAFGFGPKQMANQNIRAKKKTPPGGQKTGETERAPTRKPHSTSSGLLDPFGLKTQGAPSLKVSKNTSPNQTESTPHIGHAFFRSERDKGGREQTKTSIADVQTQLLKAQGGLEKRGEKAKNLARRTDEMTRSAEKFAAKCKAIREAQEDLPSQCIGFGGGKKSRRKKKKKHKNRKKGTRKKKR